MTPADSPPDPTRATSGSPAVTAEGEAFVSAPQRLRYVEVATPLPGCSVVVAPGVRWARIPLPMELDHINVWLLDVEDGCVIVDSGIAAPIGKDAWAALGRDVFARQPVRAVFVTHIHPDHIGLANWLQEQHGVPVLMSARTHELARMLLGGQGDAQPGTAEAFYRSHGLSDIAQIQPMLTAGRWARLTSGLPRVEQHVADSDVLPWQPHQWTALQTDGHAEGHLCLWNARVRVLISGDQVLPTISSNISFGFRVGDTNPLKSYLDSLQRLRALPADTLVLPSHGKPFRGLQHRLDDLIGHHEEQLAVLPQLCDEPRTAVELLPFLFRRELKGLHLFLALGEALAHLEYLVHAEQLQRQTTAGMVRYQRSA